MNIKHNATIAATAKTLTSIEVIPESITRPMAAAAAAEGVASKRLDDQFEQLRLHWAKAAVVVGKSVKTCQYRRGITTALIAIQPLTGWSESTLRQYASAFFGCLATGQAFDRNFRSNDKGGGSATDEKLLADYIRKALRKAHELGHAHYGHLEKTARLFGVVLD